MGLDLLKDRLAIVAVKDLTWEQTPDPQLGKARWQSKIVPLKQGIVPWPRVFDCLDAAHYSGWLSLHSEYQGWRSWTQLSVPELVEQTREDLAYLKKVALATANKNLAGF
jgi:sugar phosphate isomerase/epimerase